MPTISKQSPTTLIKKPTVGGGGGGGVLSRIIPVTSKPRKGVKLLSYGRGKTGKTRLFATFPKPALLIGTEDGAASVTDVIGLDFVQIANPGELEPLIQLIASGKYKSVGLDTAGGYQDLILKEFLGLEEMPVQKNWGMTNREGWGAIGVQFKERMNALLRLADSGVHINVIAHERNFKEEGDASDVSVAHVGAALTPSAAAWLNGACDYICQCYIREEVVVKQAVVSKDKDKAPTGNILSKTGKMEFCLRVGPHASFMTGFRRPKSAKIALPDAIVDPTFDKIYSLISG